MLEESLTINSLLEELLTIHVTWFHDLQFFSLVHYPSGHNLFTPALMRGEGRMCVLGGLYNKQFRRMTVDAMQKFDARGFSFHRHFPDTGRKLLFS